MKNVRVLNRYALVRPVQTTMRNGIHLPASAKDPVKTGIVVGKPDTEEHPREGATVLYVSAMDIEVHGEKLQVVNLANVICVVEDPTEQGANDAAQA